MIIQFRGEYAFLSNMYPCDIWYGGVTYPSVENYFQARKTHDDEARQKIIEATPQEAKKLGRKVKLIPYWDEIKVGAMEQAISAKFNQHKDLREKLIATGNQTLLEGNYWHDNFWGSCLCNEHQLTQGVNALGIILMRCRLKYIKG